MDKNLELYGLEYKTLQSDSSKSLLGTINTGFDENNIIISNKTVNNIPHKPISYKLCNITTVSSGFCSTNEDSILNEVDTGFGLDKTIITDCKEPTYKTHLCKELYLGEFKSETEKTLARNNLNVYSKEETHLILTKISSDLVTKSEFEERVKDLDYTTSRSKSSVNYVIPDNLFK